MTLFEQPPRGGQGDVPGTPRHRRAAVIGWLAAIVGIAVLADVATGSHIASWVAQTSVSGFAAPAPAQDALALADQMFLSDEGRSVFFEMQPEILDAAGIEEACPDVAADSPVEQGWYNAGCFMATTFGGTKTVGRIYILRPVDPRLAEQMVTTGAHELLHAFYAQLGENERAFVDGLVAAEAARIPVDDVVHAQIESSTGGDERNRSTEQFAYLGSQVMPDGGFAPELEAIYARTFTDRAALVDVYRRTTGIAP